MAENKFRIWINAFDNFAKQIKNSSNVHYVNVIFGIIVYFNRDKIFGPTTLHEINKVAQLQKEMGVNPQSPSYYQDLADTTLENESFLNLTDKILLDVIEVVDNKDVNDEDTNDGNTNNRMNINGFMIDTLPKNLD